MSSTCSIPAVTISVSSWSSGSSNTSEGGSCGRAVIVSLLLLGPGSS